MKRKLFYQLIIRNEKGQNVQDQTVSIRAELSMVKPVAQVVYREVFSLKTDEDAIVNIELGTGNTLNGIFDRISWDKGDFQIIFSADTESGKGFNNLAVMQVPPLIPSSNVSRTANALSNNSSDDISEDLHVNGVLYVYDAKIQVNPANQSQFVHHNLFIGWGQDSANTAGINFENIIIGNQAAMNAINHTENILIGKQSGISLSGFSKNNVFIGNNTGLSDQNSNNRHNVAIGAQAGQKMTGNQYTNIYIGYRAGMDSMGVSNIALGRSAGMNNQSNYNIFIGHNCGFHNTTGEANTFVGAMDCAASNLTGKWNTFFGGSCGEDNVYGSYNAYMGHSAGHHAGGNNNTFIGYASGFNCKTGNNNVFIGNNAGYNEAGSNKLYISNSDSSIPLIYGEFDSGKLAINANTGINVQRPVRALHVKDVIRLEPRPQAPDNPSEGDMYMDNTDHKLKVYNGTEWKECW